MEAIREDVQAWNLQPAWPNRSRLPSAPTVCLWEVNSSGDVGRKNRGRQRAVSRLPIRQVGERRGARRGRNSPEGPPSGCRCAPRPAAAAHIWGPSLRPPRCRPLRSPGKVISCNRTAAASCRARLQRIQRIRGGLKRPL